MITLFIEADAQASDRLTRTLAAVIPAVVEGVVLDAVILNKDGSAEIEKVADAAGAVSVAGGDVAAGVEKARGDWLMCLEPGARPQGEWYDVVLSAIADADKVTTGPARFRSDGSMTGGLMSLFRRPRALRYGLIIHRRQAVAAKAKSLEALARGRATRRLSARLMPADP